VLRNEAVGYGADLWALGCLLHQMLTGRPPFRGASEYLTFQRILAHDLAPLPASLPAPARDLIARLLADDPAARLGAAASPP
jgi:3-phosphoinositide dependent protein kinase-1